MEKETIQIGEKTIEFKKPNWTIRANGEALLRCGNTEVLAAAVTQEDLGGKDFFPLTVNFEERFYAAGEIMGSRYIRREGRPSDNAVLISRLIDRTLRPLFPEGFKNETQVIITCLSFDEKNDPDTLGILAASLSLAVSDIPWKGPIAAVRVGLVNDKLIVNPTYEEREKSALDIIFSGTRSEGEIVINMIEASAEELPEKTIIEALDLALPEIEKLLSFQEKICEKIAKAKMAFSPESYPEIDKKIKEFLKGKIEEIIYSKKQENEIEGIERGKKIENLRKELLENLKEFEDKTNYIKEVFEKEIKEIVQKKILEEDRRPDGRKLDEVRPIECRVEILPHTHGSGYFSRGVTRSLSIVTLGGPREQQLIESMEIQGEKRFFHHYNFPPYSTGEAKPLRSPGRREIGHGMLAEKALRPVIPLSEDFPYTIRIVSEILASNGSTSQSSICSSCLALMDAGVPIKTAVAGIAIGLVKEKNKYRLLTDIQGPEDFYGQMDFKAAGSKQGITAIQMDLKIDGVNKEIVINALEKANQARMKILEEMAKTIADPKKELSPYAPKIKKIKIDPEKIGEVIGSKGQTIKAISEKTNAQIDIDDSGEVFITAQKTEEIEEAVKMIEQITKDIELGEMFEGEVVRVMDFGSLIEITPKQKGLLRNSSYSRNLKLGDKIKVKVIGIDSRGRVDLGSPEAKPSPKRSFDSRRRPEKKYDRPTRKRR